MLIAILYVCICPVLCKGVELKWESETWKEYIKYEKI